MIPEAEVRFLTWLRSRVPSGALMARVPVVLRTGRGRVGAVEPAWGPWHTAMCYVQLDRGGRGQVVSVAVFAPPRWAEYGPMDNKTGAWYSTARTDVSRGEVVQLCVEDYYCEVVSGYDAD